MLNGLLFLDSKLDRLVRELPDEDGRGYSRGFSIPCAAPRERDGGVEGGPEVRGTAV